jgi:5-deoxy-glucuronate isomerase
MSNLTVLLHMWAKGGLMRQYTSENLVVRPGGSLEPDVIVEVTPELAGWEHIYFQVRRLVDEQSWSSQTGENEQALVILGGVLDVRSNQGEWKGLGERANVFAGLPTALYLPPGTTYTLQAHSTCEVALAWTPALALHPARLVRPADIKVEIRGGDHATRHINQILPPGFPCARLVVVEVYTPAGNWSSYPPHKHDVHRVGPDGRLLEADLEEVYFYKIDRPEGYAFQRIYTGLDSPLQRAGRPIDAVVAVRNNDVVLIPEGYHPVSSPPGYTSYYLNILAGSAQSLAAVDDPAFAWVKTSYRTRDPRVPVYPVPPQNILA